MDIVLVFDGDDTLWMNERQYSKARADFLAFLCAIFGSAMPSLRVAIERLYKFDSDLYSLWGVQRGRVFFAMLHVYREILGYLRGRLSERQFQDILKKQREHEKRIYEIGDQPFNFHELEWLEFAQEVLGEFKRDPRITLCLLTSYDEALWPDRAEFLGVREYFDRVLAVSATKTKENFIEVSGWRNKCPNTLFYAIGNGPKDILPALEISQQWHGIHIPFGLEAPIVRGEHGKDVYTPPPVGDPRVMTLRRIEELRMVDFERFCIRDSS